MLPDEERNARAVLASAADPIVAVDEAGRVTLWNPAAERLFGWSAEEIAGRVPPIVPDELTAEHHAVLERVRSVGSHVSIGTRRRTRARDLIDVRIDTSALRDAEGGLTGWVSVFHPVAEPETRAVAEKARLVRRLNDILADLNAALDLDLVLDRITAALVELTGADAAAFVRIEGSRLRLVTARGLPDEMLGTAVDLEPSLVTELLDSGRDVMLASGQRVTDLIWQRLPDLHTVALGMAHLANRPYGALYALFAGRTTGHTELELLELLAGHAGVAVGNAVAYQEVVRQRAHERAVIDASADGIAVLDTQGLVCQWNPAATRITGRDAISALGSGLPFPFSPGETVTHLLPNGTWIDVLAARIEETGEIVVDFRDVTAAKELEESKDLFLATTGHELRTPITVVQGFAETLVTRWDELPDAERRKAVGLIADRGRAMGKLVEQLLLGSRAGSARPPVTPAPFDLGGLLHRVVPAFRTLSQEHRLECDVPDGLPTAYGDMMATDIIVGQLVENAYKYSPEGGLIEVAAGVAGGCLVVTIDDEGVGIAPGDHERIFERFVQGEAGDRRRFGGVGLGLYIARRLATAQGGDVTAHSRPGRGTRMRLTVPMAETVDPDLRETFADVTDETSV
ncbi:PAS domain S-box protein [Actinocorallia sp. A-T 12471]|uniref:PAS domain-containing sensor histidine kinase n=1 Tax=Actinocorallia sp. A-T 12471 TaxID=3089813 RepID=UPI0029D2307C|nr:PAS domain S-box protein [Actinocorallia sp. A-T 12471]MDX6742082.1 PAS domain S-box protein [Actinocorallia sp. A-T 12471]